MGRVRRADGGGGVVVGREVAAWRIYISYPSPLPPQSPDEPWPSPPHACGSRSALRPPSPLHQGFAPVSSSWQALCNPFAIRHVDVATLELGRDTSNACAILAPTLFPVSATPKPPDERPPSDSPHPPPERKKSRTQNGFTASRYRPTVTSNGPSLLSLHPSTPSNARTHSCALATSSPHTRFPSELSNTRK